MWRAYLAGRRASRDDSYTDVWKQLCKVGEDAQNFAKLKMPSSEDERRVALRALTFSALSNGNTAPDPIKILQLAGILNDLGVMSTLVRQHKVNYQGHLCARLVSSEQGGASPYWDSEAEAFVVKEQTEVIIEAWFDADATGRSLPACAAEIDINGGVDRAMTPFWIGLDGCHPLRFERRAYDSIQVPVKGVSERFSFAIKSASLMARTEPLRVWVNCRHNNSLVQCVCIPILIIKADKARRGATSRKTAKK
jgi:hypothetical protein